MKHTVSVNGGEFVKDVFLKGKDKDDTLLLKNLFDEGYVLLATDQTQLGNEGWEYFLGNLIADSIRLNIRDRIVRIEPLHWTMVKNDIHLKKRMKQQGFEHLSPRTSQIAFKDTNGIGTIGIAEESSETFLSAAKALMRHIRIENEPSANKERE